MVDFFELEDLGFAVSDKVFDRNEIISLNKVASKLQPFVGMLQNFEWMNPEKASQKNLDWAYYWSQIPEDNSYINDIILPTLSQVADKVFLDDWGWQMTNRYIISNFKHDCPIRVHLDAPYVWPQKPELRMDDYLEEAPLSITFMIPLINFTKENGSTGYVPGSHKYRYDPRDLLRPDSEPSPYDRFFEDNYMQADVECGKFMCFYGNTLHSVMPNRTDIPRRAIILRAIRQDALDEMNRMNLG